MKKMVVAGCNSENGTWWNDLGPNICKSIEQGEMSGLRQIISCIVIN